MTNNGTSGASKDLRLAEVLDAYLAGVRAGTAPAPDVLLAEHPDLAGDLQECLTSLAFLRQAGQPGAAEAPANRDGTSCQLGDYRIVREIGRGGMGIVYEAEQVSLGRRVALKVLPLAATMDPRHLQRFHNEARAAAGLHHTNIVPVYGVGCERGVHYYAMQFIEGRTLADLIAAQRGAPSPQPEGTAAAGSAPTVPQAAQPTSAAPRDAAYFRRVAEWGIQAAEALDCAHALGVVHRDVKPANLLVDGTGRLWVTDFGLAQIQSDARLTMTGDLVGTLRYMSPEQALAKRVVIDHRTDIYSLGATLYELLTLEPVFTGADRQELLRQIAFEEPQKPRRRDRVIPAELETIVLKAIEKLPQDRYTTAKEMADDLRRFLEDKPISARRPNIVHRLSRWSKRHQAALVATCLFLIVAVVGLAVGSVLLWRQKKETENALERAEKQERLASANAARADAQRKRAESLLNWSFYAIHHVLARLDGEEFADLPAVPDIKRRLVAHAARFYRDHMDETSTDPGVRQNTACLYGSVAMMYSHLGDHDQARAAFAKAGAILEALTIDFPDHAAHWTQRGHNHSYLAEECECLGLMDQAAAERGKSIDAFLQALRLDPQDVATWNNTAWHLANNREPGLRDPARAIELAGKAVELAPTKWQVWNTLGAAHYRRRDWRAAIDSLKKSLSLPGGDHAWNHYFLALAHWQLGEKKEARRRYDAAVRWLTANPQGQEPELRRIDAEAAELLGIKESDSQDCFSRPSAAGERTP